MFLLGWFTLIKIYQSLFMEKFTPNVYQNARSCFKQKVEVQTKCVLFGHNIKDIISQTVCCFNFNLSPLAIIVAIYML